MEILAENAPDFKVKVCFFQDGKKQAGTISRSGGFTLTVALRKQWPSARIPRDRISRIEPLNRCQGSAAVPGCECRRRLAASSIAGRDARPTRRRDACATRFMGRSIAARCPFPVALPNKREDHRLWHTRRQFRKADQYKPSARRAFHRRCKARLSFSCPADTSSLASCHRR